ncbi:hypothetical protein LSTR_LSTR012841 [Laodelphax striatellus]|uniref:MADF domain-containing protein n=1 Tax=Laodelphax striatellus TaxID=195883 RepID=A0A482XE13_LAOST|nr:hypothetical protein LSTR_LSTR012841 [Laodelphax striatellus]
MEWNNAKVCELIELYRDRPILWDCRLKAYKDKNKKQDALQEIADTFGVDKQVVKKKIRNLVCHFLREVKRERDSSKSGAGNSEVYKSKWFCYNNMIFLKDRNTPNATTDTITQDNPMPELLEEASELRLNMPSASSAPSFGCRKRSRSDTADYHLQPAVQMLQREEDQYDKFAGYIAAKLREMDERQNIFAENLISQVLFQGALGKLQEDSTIHTPHSSSASSNVARDHS